MSRRGAAGDAGTTRENKGVGALPRGHTGELSTLCFSSTEHSHGCLGWGVGSDHITLTPPPETPQGLTPGQNDKLWQNLIRCLSIKKGTGQAPTGSNELSLSFPKCTTRGQSSRAPPSPPEPQP